MYVPGHIQKPTHLYCGLVTFTTTSSSKISFFQLWEGIHMPSVYSCPCLRVSRWLVHFVSFPHLWLWKRTLPLAVAEAKLPDNFHMMRFCISVFAVSLFSAADFVRAMEAMLLGLFNTVHCSRWHLCHSFILSWVLCCCKHPSAFYPFCLSTRRTLQSPPHSTIAYIPSRDIGLFNEKYKWVNIPEHSLVRNISGDL